MSGLNPQKGSKIKIQQKKYFVFQFSTHEDENTIKQSQA